MHRVQVTDLDGLILAKFSSCVLSTKVKSRSIKMQNQRIPMTVNLWINKIRNQIFEFGNL